MPSTFRPSPLTKTSSIQKKKMSLTQTYYLAHTARAKLSKEAARADHDLRLLVGHANLLDGLMLDLVDAEREQESWFNQTVRSAQTSQASQSQEAPKHIQWADQVPTIAEEYDEEEDESSDSESESDDDEVAETLASLRQAAVGHASAMEIDEEDDQAIDDEEDYMHLQLTRIPSHSSPPELSHEHDSDSDEDMPPSPPAPKEISFASQTRKSIQPQHHNAAEEALYEDGFYLPPRAVAVY